MVSTRMWGLLRLSVLSQRGHDGCGGHRELGHPGPYGVVDGVGEGGQGWNDVRLPYPSDAERVAGIGTSTITVSIIGRSNEVGIL